MGKRKKLKQTEFQIQNNKTGEIIGPYFPKKKSHKFYLTFYREMAKYNLIFGLVGEMDNKNRIFIDARLKSVLARHYNTSSRFIQKTFNRMVNKGWALRLSRGQYFVSPHLFYKGELDRIEILKTEFDNIKSEQNRSMNEQANEVQLDSDN
jgi:hypothetical protein